MSNIGPRDALIGSVAYMLVVIAALVVPASPPHPQRGYLLDITLGGRLAADVALNIVMFVPLGWGLRRALRRAGAPRRSAALAVVLAATFSLAMETVQAWLPNRYSSVLDVLGNTLGATVGVWMESRSARRV